MKENIGIINIISGAVAPIMQSVSIVLLNNIFLHESGNDAKIANGSAASTTEKVIIVVLAVNRRKPYFVKTSK